MDWLKKLSSILTFSLAISAQAAIPVPDKAELGIPTNYITNGGAERNLANVSKYADGAAIPVDGIGGSPTLTVAASSTSPLAGNKSFLITPGALGDGISIPFTIDAKDKAKVLSISLEYALSGTIADGDYTFYIYDVTNANMIQPSSYQIKGTSGTNYTFKSIFQTASNSTSYRFIINQSVANPGSASVTLKLDNISVSPQSYVIGAAVTDWKTYPLTIGGTTTAPTKGSISNDTAYYRYVGDSMEIQYNYFQSGAGANGSGTYLFPLPSGNTIDTTKAYAAAGNYGAGAVGGGAVYNGTTAYPAAVTVYNTTNLSLTANNAQVGSAFAGLATAATQYSFHALVPIVGKSSNTLMSSDSDQRLIAMLATANPPTASAYDGTANVVLGTVTQDTSGSYNSSTGTYTVGVSGTFRVSSSLVVNTTSPTFIQMELWKSGSRQYLSLAPASISATGYQANGVWEIPCVAGDTLSVRINTNGTSTSFASGTQRQYLSISRLAGPTAVAATESVNASYQNNAGSNINGTAAVVSMPTRIFDSHMAMASNGTFTAPVSGKYQVSALFTISSATLSTTQGVVVDLWKSGSFYKNLNTTFGNGGATTFRSGGTALISLNAGDTIGVAASIATGGSVSLLSTVGYNWVDITRVGN